MAQFEPSLLATDAAERARFLAALRTTGSVAAAARRTGTTRSTAYTLRRRDPDFAAAWAAALAPRSAAPDPVAALEAALLHRATHGVERYRFGRDGVEIWVEHDNKLAIQLIERLSAKAAAVAEPTRRMTRAEFIEVIEARSRRADLPPEWDEQSA